MEPGDQTAARLPYTQITAIPQVEREKLSAFRQRLRANGYTPLANRDKRCVLPGWPKIEVTDQLIDKWSHRNLFFQATGLRLDGDLVAIDIDVNDTDFVEALFWAVKPEIPTIADALMRGTRGDPFGAKEAWFVRCAEPFTRLATFRYLFPGASLDDDEPETAQVEVFGAGGRGRQFGAFGPHTIDSDELVTREYEWLEGRSPENVPLCDLPVLTKKQIAWIVDAASQMLQARDFQMIPPSQGDNPTARFIYDLTDDMAFDCNDARTWTLEELEFGHYRGLRCSANWHDATSTNRTRCIVGERRSDGELTIWDSAQDAVHMRADLQPPAERSIVEVGQKLEATRQSAAKRPAPGARPPEGADFDDAVLWLLESYAYCATMPRPVIPIHADRLSDGMTMANLKGSVAAYGQIIEGPRGGQKTINPADIWMVHPERVNAASQQMRPEMPVPLFRENGATHINIYRAPVDVSEPGTAEPFHRFLAHLIPDISERDWFVQWLGYKVAHPDVPGPAVILVAKGVYGAGRGTLFRIIAKLIGEAYVQNLPNSLLTGTVAQAQYNDWAATALVACVDESTDIEQGSVYRHRRAVYERLKEMVAPEKRRITVVRKTIPNGIGVTSTSYIIATNHADALPLDVNDRRFAVLSNGGALPEAMTDEINDWMAQPSNVTAVRRWLRALGTDPRSDYNPYRAPLSTTAKQDMARQSMSSIDLVIEAAESRLREQGAQVFTADLFLQHVAAEQVENADIGNLRDEYGTKWQDIIRRQIGRRYERALLRVAGLDSQGRMRFNGRRHTVYLIPGAYPHYSHTGEIETALSALTPKVCGTRLHAVS